METNVILANVVYALHLVLICFMIVAPFTNKLALLILHITFSISLVLHWSVNSNVCCLSYAESWLRGVEVNKTFLNRIIEPVYVISENKLSNIIWISTVVLVAISVYKVYIHENLPKLLECRSIHECALLLK